MTRIVQLIRLLASVVILLAACTFVVLYDRVATMRYPYDHPNTVGHWKGGEFVLEIVRMYANSSPRTEPTPMRRPLQGSSWGSYLSGAGRSSPRLSNWLFPPCWS